MPIETLSRRCAGCDLASRFAVYELTLRKLPEGPTHTLRYCPACWEELLIGLDEALQGMPGYCKRDVLATLLAKPAARAQPA